MKKIKEKEMKVIKGGTTAYTTALNTVIKAITVLLNLGQTIGGAIRRTIGKNYCEI